jgi:hypothetical protein
MIEPHSPTLAVCHQLAEAGLWLKLTGEGELRVGPTALVKEHPHLLEQVRVQKAAILEVLRESLAYQTLSASPDAPGRFELETCPACQQPSFVVTAPRRLAVHRTPDGSAVCPGAIRVQEDVAHLLLQRYIVERCVQRPGSVLSWMALRGGIEGWAREQSLLLPPHQYLIAWMDTHYDRMGKDETYPSWRGLSFTVEEWLGEDESAPAGVADAPGETQRSRHILRAS